MVAGGGEELSQIMKAQASNRDLGNTDVKIMGLIGLQNLLFESIVTAYSATLDSTVPAKAVFLPENKLL